MPKLFGKRFGRKYVVILSKLLPTMHCKGMQTETRYSGTMHNMQNNAPIISVSKYLWIMHFKTTVETDGKNVQESYS